MDWEQVRHLVNVQISHWRSVGKHEWAEALEQCLAKAERCQALQDIIGDLRIRLEVARRLIEE